MSNRPKIKDRNKNEPFVELGKIRRFLKTVESQPDSMPLTFEFMMSMCFPTIYNTIQDYSKDQFTKGFIEGRKSIEDENKGNN